jgi:hypothetical protein
MTISKSNWTTVLIDTCIASYSIASAVSTSGTASAGSSGGNLVLTAPAASDMLVITQNAAAGVMNTVQFDISRITGGGDNGVQVIIVEEINNIEYVIGSGYLQQGSKQTLTFTPTFDVAKLKIYGPFDEMLIATTCTKKAATVQHTYLVDVCDEDKDRYRFGYQGSEKTNEIAGLGNHYTTFFRELDVRTVRWWTRDPKAASQSWQSPYVVNGNSPILLIDPLGDKEFSSYKAYKKELGADAIAQKDWVGQDGHWLASHRKSKGNFRNITHSGKAGQWHNSFANANDYNIRQSNGSSQYVNLEQRKAFYSWMQDATEKRGFETRWAGGAAQAIDKLEYIEGMSGSALSVWPLSLSNDEIQNWIRDGNKLILDDAWKPLQGLYLGSPLTGKDAYNWDAKMLLQEQMVINPSYWNLSNGTLTTLENSLRKNYISTWLFSNGPTFKGTTILSVTDRWVHGMTMMNYSVTEKDVPIPASCSQCSQKK